MARKTLDKWIAEAINDPDKDGKLDALVLMHMQGGHQQMEIHTTKLKGVEVNPKELADMFMGKAETFCQDLDGRQLFQLQAFYGKKECEARFPFVCARAVDPMATGLATEPPDATGQLMQNMRHKETAHTAISGLIGQVYARQQAMDNHSLRMIEQLSSMNQHLTAENFNNFGMIKELLFKLADDSHKSRLEEIRMQQAADTRKQLMTLAPALLNSVTDREIFPQATEDTALIESIVGNLTEEQGEAFPMFLQSMGVPASILGPLAARITKALLKKRDRNMQIERVATTYKGSPESDIGGGSDE